ncbi:MAG: hypothetical protein AB7W28_11470 [Armatimonadota bacterium]
MPKWAIAVSAMILIAGLIGYMGLRPSMSEEDQIYHLIGEMEQAANRNDLLSLLRYVAEDYKDTFGHTRDSLKALALQAERSLTLLRVKVSVTGLVRVGSRATLQADVLLWEGSQSQPENYRVKATLEKRGRKWMIVNAEGWQEAAYGDTGGE